MIYIQNDFTNPFFNHALEEYVMTQMQEEAFILWRNEPSILIGRNQNTLSEIHMDFVKANGIQVVRRLSGGGTVFCDLGNINFTFITRKTGESNGFEKFANPVIEALRSLGVPAQFTGRNDIVIDGKKFSGNAQYHTPQWLLHHGTLLYSGDLSALAGALKSKHLKFKDKSVKSVGSRVTNIADHMAEPMDVLSFREYLKTFIMKSHGIDRVYSLTQEDLSAIARIQETRFESYNWNYGKSPDFTYNHECRLTAGTFEFNAHISEGRIHQLSINGDFFGEKPMEELCEALKGTAFTEEALAQTLKAIDFKQYVSGVSETEFVSALLGLRAKRPDWLKVKLQGGQATEKVKVLLSELSLNTVCQEANCPNRMECYSRGTATFMILGRNCTRNCTFCNVTRLMPDPVDQEEPEKVARAIQKLGLKHAVITSVTRDDLPDQGAGHFAEVVKAIRKLTPEVVIELLIPDFQGETQLLDRVLDSQPDILNHNVETVPELYETVRPMADFERSLRVLAHVKNRYPDMKTKSGIMLGLGETDTQLMNALKALRKVDCDILTLGQYLQPSEAHIPVVQYVRPEKFEALKGLAEGIGFKSVASSPLVRSSYHADQLNF